MNGGQRSSHFHFHTYTPLLIQMSMFSARFSSAVTALRGELSAAPQTASDTIGKLVEKINTSALVDDRRTAVLGLKGLSRDWKAEVGKEAFPALLAVLKHDAPFDVDIAKACLETLMVLCETAEKVGPASQSQLTMQPQRDDPGLKHIDIFLEVGWTCYQADRADTRTLPLDSRPYLNLAVLFPKVLLAPVPVSAGDCASNNLPDVHYVSTASRCRRCSGRARPQSPSARRCARR